MCKQGYKWLITMHNNLFQYQFFFLCKKSFTEAQPFNPVINARLYIYSKLLPFSTSILRHFPIFSKYLNMCHFKGRKVVLIVFKIMGVSTSL